MFEIKFVDIFCSAFGTAAAANGGVIDEKLAEKLLEEEVSSLKDNTVCPGSSDPKYLVTYYINWVTTSWT